MLPRPAWLAVGVLAAAAVGTAAAGLAGAGGRPGPSRQPGPRDGRARGGGRPRGGNRRGRRACAAARRPAWAAGFAVASLGAAIVVTRLAFGAVAGPAAGAGLPGAAPLPAGTGPWQATVESAHASKGQQIATLSVSVPDAGAGAGRAQGRPRGAAGTGATVTCSAVAPAFPRLLAGDRVTWSGRVRPLGDTDYEAWLAAQGIAATCEPTELAVVGHDDSPAGRLEGFRQASGDALQRVLPEPEGGLAAAILIGLRDRVDRDVAADFTTAGVSHIVAISGWNIAIVAATVAAMLGSLVGRRRRAFITLAAILAYTLFAGASPSVVRAAVMAAVALLAVESGRGSRAMVGLAWAVAAMVVAEPATVGDVGFQLSAAATAGLVAWATPLTRRLEAGLPWLPGPLRESLGVSLAAQAATLPIALLTFGRLALIAPAANLVAVPLVPPAMAAGALAFVAGGLGALGAPSWLCGLLALPAWALLAALIWVVHLAASVPGANETLAFPANAVAAAAAGLALCLVHRQLRAPSSRQVRAGSPRKAGPSTRAARAEHRTGRLRHRRGLRGRRLRHRAGRLRRVVATGRLRPRDRPRRRPGRRDPPRGRPGRPDPRRRRPGRHRSPERPGSIRPGLGSAARRHRADSPARRPRRRPGGRRGQVSNRTSLRVGLGRRLRPPTGPGSMRWPPTACGPSDCGRATRCDWMTPPCASSGRTTARCGRPAWTRARPTTGRRTTLRSSCSANTRTAASC